MLAFAAAGGGSAAFARAEESAWVRPLSGSDVFARRERNDSTGSLRPRKETIDIELSVGGQSIQFTYRGNALPDWGKDVLESVAERWGCGSGWDGYDAHPTDPALVAELLNCLDLAIPSGGSSPLVTPLSDGGVQAEWHKGNLTLEIVVSADEPPRFYFHDPASSREEEGSFEGSVSLIRSLVGRF